MRTRRAAAFSLIEIMVSMTLLAVIIAGLLVVFNYTSRALRAANNTTDVLEGARATVGFVATDFQGMAASGISNNVNFYTFAFTWPPWTMQMLDGTTRSNIFHDTFFLTRENDRWSGVGYFLDPSKQTAGVGTLYRFDVETNGPFPDVNWMNRFLSAKITDTNVHLIADGVIHFELSAYDEKGRIYPAPTATNDVLVVRNGMTFQNDSLPAHVQLEIGLMEPETLRKFHAINFSDSTAARNFLVQQAGKMHLFRRRVAVRNHSEPRAFDR